MALLCASVLPRALENGALRVNKSDRSTVCQLDLWLTNVGYTLLISSLLVKTYRCQSRCNATAHAT